MNYPQFDYVKDVYYGTNKVVVFINNNDLLDLVEDSGNSYICIDNNTSIIHDTNNTEGIYTCLNYILSSDYPEGKSVKDYFEIVTNIMEKYLNTDPIIHGFEDYDEVNDEEIFIEDNYDNVKELFISDDKISYKHGDYYRKYFDCSYVCERLINRTLYRIVIVRPESERKEPGLEIEEALSIIIAFFNITNDNINNEEVDEILEDYYQSCNGSYIIRQSKKSARN